LIQKSQKKAYFTGFWGGTSPADGCSVNTHLESKTMKKTLIAMALASLTLPALAQQKAPEPDYTISGNFGVFSDYRYRGISQTRLGPTVQGGVDFAHKSGFYLGNWNSNVSSVQLNGGSGGEMDFYGGYKTSVGSVGVDIGTLYYYYPGATITTSASNSAKLDNYDTQEIYLGLSFGPVSLKTSYSLTDYFGLNARTDEILGATAKATGDTKGTIYYDLSVSHEIFPKTVISAHAGRTEYKTWTNYSYSDYRIGISRDFDGWVIGLNYYTNSMNAATKSFNTNNTVLHGTAGSLAEKKLYKSAAVISLTKTF